MIKKSIHRFLRNVAGIVIISSIFVVLTAFAQSAEELAKQLANPNATSTTTPSGNSDISQ